MANLLSPNTRRAEQSSGLFAVSESDTPVNHVTGYITIVNSARNKGMYFVILLILYNNRMQQSLFSSCDHQLIG